MNSKALAWLSFALTGLVSHAAGQAPPATDIYLVKLGFEEGRVVATEPVNATDRDGYDNQPCFLPDSSAFLYTSIREGQADIYRLDVEERKAVRLTETAESEYSPTVTLDGDHFSVIRVETSEPLMQRLWRFDLDGTKPELVLEDVNPVGYHAWASGETLCLFVLGEPATLMVADRGTARRETKARNIGRCLTPVSLGSRVGPAALRVSFVDKSDPSEWWIRTVDTRSGDIQGLVKTLDGSEHHAWTPRGEILMAQGSKLFVWKKGASPDWEEIADFSKAGIKSITRLAVSPDGHRLALVAARSPSREQVRRPSP